MSDIVKRLRTGLYGTHPIIEEAAREIEQLRSMRTALQEETQRLRVKLETREARDPSDFV